MSFFLAAFLSLVPRSTAGTTGAPTHQGGAGQVSLRAPSGEVSDGWVQTFQGLLEARGYEKFRFLDFTKPGDRALLMPLWASTIGDLESVQAMPKQEQNLWMAKVFSRAGLKLHERAGAIEKLVLSEEATIPALEKADRNMDFIVQAAKFYSDSGAVESYASLRRAVRERLERMRLARIEQKIERTVAALGLDPVEEIGTSAAQENLNAVEAGQVSRQPMTGQALVQELHRAIEEGRPEEIRRLSLDVRSMALSLPEKNARKLVRGLAREMFSIKLHGFYRNYWVEIRFKRTLAGLLEKIAARTPSDNIKEDVIRALAHDAHMTDDPDYKELALGAVGRVVSDSAIGVKALGRLLIASELERKQMDSPSLLGTVYQLPQSAEIVPLTLDMAARQRPGAIAAGLSFLSMILGCLSYFGLPLFYLPILGLCLGLLLIRGLKRDDDPFQAFSVGLYFGVIFGSYAWFGSRPPSTVTGSFWALLSFFMILLQFTVGFKVRQPSIEP